MRKKKKYLVFYHHDERFVVNERGYITKEWPFDALLKGREPEFSAKWKLLGVSMHHWRRGIDFEFETIFKDPELMNGGLVWDSDHGTARQWGGCYRDRIPRATGARIIEV